MVVPVCVGVGIVCLKSQLDRLRERESKKVNRTVMILTFKKDLRDRKLVRSKVFYVFINSKTVLKLAFNPLSF